MSEKTKMELKEAIEKAKNWANDGWKVTFGHNAVEVNNLKAALEMPRTFSFRQEAIAYWRNVEDISVEVTKYLEGALVDLEQNNLKAAENKLYFAQYFEKPLEKFTNTSKPLYQAVIAK